MSYSSSRKWESKQTREQEKYSYVVAQMRRLFNPTAQVPWTFSDWVAQRSAMQVAKARREQKKLEARQQQRNVPAIGPSCGGPDKIPKGNRSAVLAQETMWCVDWQTPERWGGTRWPDHKELAYEGSQRHASNMNYGRELPLVRAWQPGNETVTYERVARLPEYDLDAVRRIPTYEDLYYPVDEIDEDVGEHLLNSDLREALNNDEVF